MLRWQLSPQFGASDAETCSVIGTDGVSVFASCVTLSDAFLVSVAVDAAQ